MPILKVMILQLDNLLLQLSLEGWQYRNLMDFPVMELPHQLMYPTLPWLMLYPLSLHP